MFDYANTTSETLTHRHNFCFELRTRCQGRLWAELNGFRDEEQPGCLPQSTLRHNIMGITPDQHQHRICLEVPEYGGAPNENISQHSTP
jgi:hypothetical protein